MNKRELEKKNYLNFITSIVLSSFASLCLTGQIVLSILGITGNMSSPYMDAKSTVIIALATFGFMFFITSLIVLIGGFKYWIIEEDGIVNGWSFFKRKLLFSELDKISIKVDGFALGIGVHYCECIFFFKKKKSVNIPIYDLTIDDLKRIKEKVSNINGSEVMREISIR